MRAFKPEAARDALLRDEPAQRDTCALVRKPKPWDMTPDERVAEMGELLALGYLRYRRKCLADGRDAERPCNQAVNTAKEVA